MKIGYDRNLTTKIDQMFIAAGTIINYSYSAGSLSELAYFECFLHKYQQHEIILYSLESIGSCTIIQLNKILTIIKEKNIRVTFLMPVISGVHVTQDFLEVLRAFVSHDKQVIFNRTTKGIDIARSEGRIGGRPPITEEIQKTIHKLYFNDKKTYREIGEELEISTGTVHKYIKKVEQLI